MRPFDFETTIYPVAPHPEESVQAAIQFGETFKVTTINPASDMPEKPTTDIDKVVDALDRRLVGDSERGRLRKSLDKADAPLGGRAGQNEAVGRALRFSR